MFIVIGILSIIAGVFVFEQARAIVVLENLLGASNYGWAFFMVSILLIVSGAVSIASKSGKKRGMVNACAIMYILAALIAYFGRSAGDLMLWAVVCSILAIVFSVSIWRNPQQAKGAPGAIDAETDKRTTFPASNRTDGCGVSSDDYVSGDETVGRERVRRASKYDE